MARKHTVNGVDIPFTPEEEAEWDAREAEYLEQQRIYKETEGYKDSRKKEYPSVVDQLDMIFHAMDAGLIPKAPDFYAAIKAVKNRYPKP